MKTIFKVSTVALCASIFLGLAIFGVGVNIKVKVKTKPETVSASTVSMLRINGVSGNLQITPGQSVTVTWQAPAGYNYCNTGVSPAPPNGWGSVPPSGIDKPVSGSYTVTPTVSYIRFGLQCALNYPGPMVIEDWVSATWSNTTITSGTTTCTQTTSPLKDLLNLNSITIVEKTGTDNTLTYNPTSSSLNIGTNDLNTTAVEHYDFYYSNADGTPNAGGAYVSSKMHRDAVGLNAQSGNNIDSLKLSFISGSPIYADLIASYQLGSSVSSVANGNLSAGLGAPNGVVTTGGDQDSRITFGFCSAFIPPITQCNDGIDNDNDQAADYPNDFSCSSAFDNDETNPKSACQDGSDSDGDGLIDYPQDPGCASKQDNDEFNFIAQCQDGIDNDNDQATDYPSDFSCSSATDNDETNPKSACQDGSDSDGDGLIDYPQDPGCFSKQDNDEFNQIPQCQDGIDNDLDGASDYPSDFSCSSATDNDESNPKSRCQDTLDNDSDNLIDWPNDPGCSNRQDDDEVNTVIICSTNAQCGTSGFIDNISCQTNDVYQNYKTYTCNNPGTTSSSCSNNTVLQLKQMCAGAQGCNTGGCFPEVW